LIREARPINGMESAADLPRTGSPLPPLVGEGFSRSPSQFEQSYRAKAKKTKTHIAPTLESLDESNPKFQNLRNLKQLYDSGFLTKTEYSERKSQLIDELTGTKSTLGESVSVASRLPSGSSAPDYLIKPRPPPDFSGVPSENAIKLEYDLAKKNWREKLVHVKLDPLPFARGGLRLVYHLQELEADEEDEEDQPGRSKEKGKVKEKKVKPSYVAKISMDPKDNQDREIYKRDVECQAIAKYYARKFNEYNPPKKVAFVKAWLYILENREGRPICGVERFIDGPYRKHNNNFGYVSEEERSTPQAFSHFTYECSGHELLICDVQGVGDMYTDPQVHTKDGKGYGKGNMGKKGMDEFLKTHRCNAVCRYLKLPAVNPQQQDLGTLPESRYMSYERVRVVVPLDAGSPESPLLKTRELSDNVAKPSHCCSCVIL